MNAAQETVLLIASYMESILLLCALGLFSHLPVIARISLPVPDARLIYGEQKNANNIMTLGSSYLKEVSSHQTDLAA